MKETYPIQIAGLHRSLPLCPIGHDLYIGAFVMFGDVELTVACAKELLKQAPDYDILITAESKGIPLGYEMAKQHGDSNWLLARRAPKLYMQNCRKVELRSITTEAHQVLYIDQTDIDAMKDRRVLIVDDVVSTGESLHALEELVTIAGGQIVGKMTVLAEGDAAKRDDLTYLAPLPLFDKNGDPIAE